MHESTISFETARIEDLPDLVRLLGLLFSQEHDFQPDTAKQFRGLELIITNPSVGTILVARENQAILGMVNLLHIISTAEGGPVVILEDLIIRPDRRGKGLGSQLLQAAIDYAKSKNFLRITLLTDADNEKAIRFYQSKGFVQSQMTPLRLDLK